MTIDHDELSELYQSLVLEHSRKPRNFGKLECSCHQKGMNPSCGDEVDLYVQSNPLNHVIDDIKFEGDGCALCISSTSLMTQAVKGKTLDEATQTVESFINFIVNEHELDEQYEPLHIYQGVKLFPLRVKCVLLGWRALEKSISRIKSEEYGN